MNLISHIVFKFELYMYLVHYNEILPHLNESSLNIIEIAESPVWVRDHSYCLLLKKIEKNR